MSLANVWHLRRVAEASAKPCEMICYKATTCVLITPDNKDFFYICQGHLTDKAFACPIVDEAEAAAKRKKEEMDREIELIKKEYEEKVKKKKKPKDSKEEKDKGQDNDKKDGKKEDDEKTAENEKDEKIKAVTEEQGQQISPAADDFPRVYALNKVFYQKRLDRLRNMEIARRNRDRLRNPTLFPSVPSGNLG